SASCGVPIRRRARPAPSGNGTCAATAATPSAASRSGTATASSASASSRNSRSRSIRRSAFSASCSSPPASSPRPGTTPSASAGARAAGGPGPRPSPAPAPPRSPPPCCGGQRNLNARVYDHNTGGPKPALVRELGATYPSDLGTLRQLAPDIVIECTGVPAVIRDCLGATAASGIVCLTGVTEPGKVFELDIGRLHRDAVLNNDAMFGTVNANRRHYEMAADALPRAPPGRP